MVLFFCSLVLFVPYEKRKAKNEAEATHSLNPRADNCVEFNLNGNEFDASKGKYSISKLLQKFVSFCC